MRGLVMLENGVWNSPYLTGPEVDTINWDIDYATGRGQLWGSGHNHPAPGSAPGARLSSDGTRTGRPGAVRCAAVSGNEREDEPHPRGRGQADGDHCEPQGQHARGLLATPSPDGASSLKRVVAS